MEALWLDLKRVICTLRLGWSSPQAGTNREPPNRERRKDRHRAQSPERAKPRSRRRPRSRTPPGIREMVELRAAPAVPGTFPERPRQRRAGRRARPADQGAAGGECSPPAAGRAAGRREKGGGGREGQNQRADGCLLCQGGEKNTVTGKPITTLEEFDAWRADYDAAKLQKDLKAGKLTPEALRSAVEQTPAIQALKKQQEQQAAADEQRRQAEAQARVNAELAEIHKLDPTINTVEDLLSMPGAKAFYDLVRKGNSFLDAYRLANFDRLTTARAEAARQQALNNARGKDHLTGTGTPQGTGAATVPPDVKAEYLAFNPDATDAEIQKHYNRYMEKPTEGVRFLWLF